MFKFKTISTLAIALLASFFLLTEAQAGKGGGGGKLKKPTAVLNGPWIAAPGEEISFSAAGSSSPNGYIHQYCFNFGDQSPEHCSISRDVTHTYANPGAYTVMLTVRDELYQYGSTADIATIEYPIPGQQADLTITEIENGRTVRRGAFLPVTITIENLDWATATGNVWNTIYFSDDTVISSDDHRMAIVDITNMPGKTSRTYEVELQIWGSIPLGEYYIYAIADEQEIIDESDETNNVLFSPTTVTIKEQNRFH